MVKQLLRLICKRKVMPSNLIYFVTNKCNCKCKHCFFWKEINKQEKELGLEEVQQVSKTIGTLLYLNITGGEPFLRKDLPEIVEAFYKNAKTKAVVIPTNGTLTKATVDMVTKMVQNCKGLNLVIYVSIDDIGEKHDKIRGFKGAFDKAAVTLKELKKIRNVSVGTLSTFSSLNQDRAKEIYYYIRDELKPEIAYFNVIRGDAKDASVKNIDINKYKELCDLIEKDMVSGKLSGYRSQWFWPLSLALNLETHKTVLKTLTEKKYNLPCYAGSLSAVMYSNGDIMPCELLNLKIGNVRDYGYDFKKLWNSENAEKIRTTIKHTRCFCTHECFMNINLLFNPKRIPSLLYKSFKLICDRLRLRA
ncbi:MAG: radical SAM protein [Candidatus Woesearchaeota archaeon]